MKKPYYKSMTFWGALLLGASTGLEGLGTMYPVVANVGQVAGTVLTAFGIRRALK